MVAGLTLVVPGVAVGVAMCSSELCGAAPVDLGLRLEQLPAQLVKL